MVFRIQPMQIDTRNRDPQYINDTVFRSSILPKSSAAPPNASYSGLLECPCTTRINKTYTHNYNSLTSNYCSKPIVDPNVCFKQASILSNTTLKNYINPTDPAVKPTARKKTNSSKSLGKELTIRLM